MAAYRNNHSFSYKRDDVAEVVEEALYLSVLLNQLDDTSLSVNPPPPRKKEGLPPAQPQTMYVPSSAYVELFSENEMPVTLYRGRGTPEVHSQHDWEMTGAAAPSSSSRKQSVAFSPVTYNNNNTTSGKDEHLLHMDASFFTTYPDLSAAADIYKPDRRRSPSESSLHPPTPPANSVSTPVIDSTTHKRRSRTIEMSYDDIFDTPSSKSAFPSAPPSRLQSSRVINHSSSGGGGNAETPEQLASTKAIRIFMLIQTWLGNNSYEEAHRRSVKNSYFLSTHKPGGRSNVTAVGSVALLIFSNLYTATDIGTPSASGDDCIGHSGGYDDWLCTKVLSLVSLQAAADIFNAWRHYTNSISRANRFYIRRLKQAGLDVIMENVVMESGKKNRSEIKQRVRADRHKRIAKSAGVDTNAAVGPVTPRRGGRVSKSSSRKDVSRLERGMRSSDEADTDNDYPVTMSTSRRGVGQGGGYDDSYDLAGTTTGLFNLSVTAAPEGNNNNNNNNKVAAVSLSGYSGNKGHGIYPISEGGTVKRLEMGRQMMSLEQIREVRRSGVELTQTTPRQHVSFRTELELANQSSSHLLANQSSSHLHDGMAVETGKVPGMEKVLTIKKYKSEQKQEMEIVEARMKAEMKGETLRVKLPITAGKAISTNDLEQELQAVRMESRQQLAELNATLQAEVEREVQAKVAAKEQAFMEELKRMEKQGLQSMMVRIDAVRFEAQAAAKLQGQQRHDEFDKQLEDIKGQWDLSMNHDEALKMREAMLLLELQKEQLRLQLEHELHVRELGHEQRIFDLEGAVHRDLKEKEAVLQEVIRDKERETQKQLEDIKKQWDLSMSHEEAMAVREAMLRLELQKEQLRLQLEHELRMKNELMTLHQSWLQEINDKKLADASSMQEFMKSSMDEGLRGIEETLRVEERAMHQHLSEAESHILSSIESSAVSEGDYKVHEATVQLQLQVEMQRIKDDGDLALAHEEALKAHEATLQLETQRELARMQIEHEYHLKEKELDVQLELQRMREQQGVHEEVLKAHDAAVQLDVQRAFIKLQMEHELQQQAKEIDLQTLLKNKEIELQLELERMRESEHIALAHEEAVKAHEETLHMQLQLELKNAKTLTHDEALRSHEEIRLVEIQLELQRMKEQQGLHDEAVRVHEASLHEELQGELIRLKESGDLLVAHEEALKAHEESRWQEIQQEVQKLKETAAQQMERDKVTREAEVKLAVRKEVLRLKASHDLELKRMSLGVQRALKDMHLHGLRSTPVQRRGQSSSTEGRNSLMHLFEPVDEDEDEDEVAAAAHDPHTPYTPSTNVVLHTPSSATPMHVTNGSINGTGGVVDVITEKPRYRSTAIALDDTIMTRKRKEQRKSFSRLRVLFKDQYRLRPGVKAVWTAVCADLPAAMMSSSASTSAAVQEHLQDKIYLHFCFWRLYRRSIYTSLALKVIRRGSAIRVTKALKCWRHALRALPNLDEVTERAENVVAAVKLRHAMHMFTINITLVRNFRTYCNKVKFKLESSLVALRAVHTMFCPAFVHSFVAWKEYAARYGITSAEKTGMRSHYLRYKKRKALTKWFERVNLWKLMRSIDFTMKGSKTADGDFIIGNAADAVTPYVIAHPSLCRAMWKFMAFAKSTRIYFSFADHQGSKILGQDLGRRNLRSAAMRNRFLSSCRIFPKAHKPVSSILSSHSRSADFNYEASTPNYDYGSSVDAAHAPLVDGRLSARLAGFRVSHYRTIGPSCAHRYGDTVAETLTTHGFTEKKRIIGIRANNIIFYDLNQQKLKLRFVPGYSDPYLNHHNKCDVFPEMKMRRRFIDKKTNRKMLREAEKHKQFAYEPRPPSVLRCPDGTFMASAPLSRIYFVRLFQRYLNAKSLAIIVDNLIHDKWSRGARTAIKRLMTYANRPERLPPKYTNTFMMKVINALRWIRKSAKIRIGKRLISQRLRLKYLRHWKMRVVSINLNRTTLRVVLRRWNMLYKYNLNTRLFLKKYAARINEAFTKWRDVMKMENNFELAIIINCKKRCKRNALKHMKKICLCMRIERRLMKKRFFWKLRYNMQSKFRFNDGYAAAEEHEWCRRVQWCVATLARHRRVRQAQRKEQKHSLQNTRRRFLHLWFNFCFTKPSKRLVGVQEHFSAVFAKRGIPVRRLTKLFQVRPVKFMQETAPQLRCSRLQGKYLRLLLAYVRATREEREGLQEIEDERRAVKGLRSLFSNTLQLANTREYTKIGAMYHAERCVRSLLRLWRLRARARRSMRSRHTRAHLFFLGRMKAEGMYALKRDVLFEREIRREKKSRRKLIITN